MELSHFREFETFCSRAIHCDTFRADFFPYREVQGCHTTASQLVILMTKAKFRRRTSHEPNRV